MDVGVSVSFGVILLSSSASARGRCGAWFTGVRSSRFVLCADGTDALRVLCVVGVEDRLLPVLVLLEEELLDGIAVRLTLLYVKHKTDGSHAYQAW